MKRAYGSEKKNRLLKEIGNFKSGIREIDVHRSVHHNINLIEVNNKMRPCSRIYYSSVS